MAYGDVLTITTTSRVVDDYHRVALSWIEDTFASILASPFHSLVSSNPLNPRALHDETEPLGEPGAMWAGLTLTPKFGSKKRIQIFTDHAWHKYLEGLSKTPYLAEVEVRKLDRHGFSSRAMARLEIESTYDAPEWFRFSLKITNSLVSWQNSLQFQKECVAFLGRQATTQRASFGSISNDGVGDWTALESSLDLDVEETVPCSERQLRGYSWVTVCSPNIAQKLGGIQALSATGAFSEVIELEYGGLLLRATDSIGEYDEPSIWQVFHALGPALPAGKAKPVRGFEHFNLVYDVDPKDFR
ncbi:hypothetical protein GCM10022254_23760 [Actinomadura meridiana]|uniref:Uncharacterized protein n=1 Tax=Actinomadura meridiana TaxID=559626 RepID=A0ABP8BY73_9ACTN